MNGEQDPRLPPWWFRPAMSFIIVVGGVLFLGWTIQLLDHESQKELILVAVGAVIGWVAQDEQNLRKALESLDKSAQHSETAAVNSAEAVKEMRELFSYAREQIRERGARQ